MMLEAMIFVFIILILILLIENLQYIFLAILLFYISVFIYQASKEIAKKIKLFIGGKKYGR